MNYATSRTNSLSVGLVAVPTLKRALFCALLSLVVCLRPAAAMQPCPTNTELFPWAKIVVEAGVKSFSIGSSGLLLDEGIPTRMVRAELEIKRVVKGEFREKEAILYGGLLTLGPIRELAIMAAVFGLGEEDTFEVELSRQELGEGVAYFSLGSCIYTKFPDFVTDRVRADP